MSVTQILVEYAASIRKQLLANPTNIEQDLAPCFKALLEKLLPLIPITDLTVSSEWAKAGVGRPDIALTRPGQPPRAFVELKAPSKPDDPAKFKDPHDKRQFERFKSLPVWAISSFSHLRTFERGDAVWSGEIVPAKAIDPNTSDAKAAKMIEAIDTGPLLRALTPLALANPPSAKDARELAGNLAYAARLVRAIVEDALAELSEANKTGHPIQEVCDVFRQELYARPEAGGFSNKTFEVLFSAAFAQTLAFGLLLVREATSKPVDSTAWNKMPDEHPLMKTALRVLSQPEVVDLLGVGFDIMIDTVNSLNEDLLAVKDDGTDPILYFYEDFLEVFDPEGRKRYGVYYTPIEVVRYMVGALDRVLREDLKTDGLDDQNVTILDPATGTGTFLLGVAERLRNDIEAKEGKPAARKALKDLMGRMFAFELLVGPYAVAHYRLHHTLAAPSKEDGREGVELPRLGVFLADTLAEPRSETTKGSTGFLYAGIGNERSEADKIKQQQPVLAIIGNPPYRTLKKGENETLVGKFIDDMWDDLKQPVKDAGWANQLNVFPEMSVAFWRWAMWKLFESDGAQGKGVIAYITNRSFLSGKPYAGLRKMMRERFDRIEIIDLRGDVRRGERADIDGDQGVFNIQVGTCITLAIADGSKIAGELAEVRYSDSWEKGALSQKAKLSWLTDGAQLGRIDAFVTVDRGPLDDMRPPPFENSAWPDLPSIFSFNKSGVKTGKNSIFTAFETATLKRNVVEYVTHIDEENYEDSKAVKYVFRPMDERWLYNDLKLLNRPGPEFQSVWGESNIGFYSHTFGIGAGPAAWCHSVLPDYDMLSGRGGYAFPLYDRRPGNNPVNLSPALLAGLAMTYGQPVTPEDVFDAMLALLSATSYTLRFAKDLEDAFPHIPFPSNHDVFERAAAIGREIRAVETFARKPGDAFLTKSLAKEETDPTGALADSIDWRDGEIILCANGSGLVSGIPEHIWQFAVSGYRLLPRWLGARAGQVVDRAFMKSMRDVVGRIAELIDLFDRADIVLAEALVETVTRKKLGLE
jgi:Type ISP C-terminal specificity domain/N-6 DNA Methylase